MQHLLGTLGNHYYIVDSRYYPHEHLPIHYGKYGTIKYSTTPEKLEKLNPKDTKHMQSVVGNFFYQSRAIYRTMLPALNDVGTAHESPTVKIQQNT